MAVMRKYEQNWFEVVSFETMFLISKAISFIKLLLFITIICDD